MNKIFKTGIVCAVAAVAGSVAYLIYNQKKESKDYADVHSPTNFKDAHSYVNARREAMKKTEVKKVDVTEMPIKVVDEPKVGQTSVETQKEEDNLIAKEEVAEKINEVKEVLKEAVKAMEEEGVSDPKVETQEKTEATKAE